MPDAGVEIKTATKHVEAAIRVISGRGFDSPRLHSTRCARSWQASKKGKRTPPSWICMSGKTQRVECPE